VQARPDAFAAMRTFPINTKTWSGGAHSTSPIPLGAPLVNCIAQRNDHAFPSGRRSQEVLDAELSDHI
jgi:hypothetical protein